MDSREDANTTTMTRRLGRSMEENTTEEHKKSGSGDSPNSSSCAMSLGDFSMASLGEFVLYVCMLVLALVLSVLCVLDYMM